jgi:hypothetical protein
MSTPLLAPIEARVGEKTERNLAQNLAPNSCKKPRKKTDFWGGYVQDLVQDFFLLKMVQILNKNLAPKPCDRTGLSPEKMNEAHSICNLQLKC